MSHNSMKNYLGFNFYDIFYLSFCIIFGLVCFYPIWYVFLGSINPSDSTAIQSLGLLPPSNPTLKYYVRILQEPVFKSAIIISFLKTFLGAFGTVIITAMLAYGVSKKHIPGMKFFNVYMVITMFFGGGLIPFFLLIVKIGMYDTFWAMVIPYLVGAGNFILMRNYFSYAVPLELEDAATVDGANEVIMFFRIIVPVSMPLFATIFLFTAVFHWNDWYSYLIFVNKAELRPFIVVLQRLLINPNEELMKMGGFLGTHLAAASLKMTVIMVAMLPILLLYPFLQKYFAKGMLLGAIKG